jgi:hypothetical protein
MLARIRYRLFQARDELRMLVLLHHVGEKEKAYPILERNCINCIRVLDDVDLAAVCMSTRSKDINLKVQHDLNIINESRPEIRKIYRDIKSAVIGAMLVNSPGIFILFLPMAVVAIGFHWFIRVRNFFRDKEIQIWGVLYTNPQQASC